MIDQSFLHWPFFTEEHRKLSKKLGAWVDTNISPNDEKNEYQAAKAYVSLLGKEGWLKYVVPSLFGGAFDQLDVRSICLIRETLARTSGLADVAFAMQGLGSYPISAFGSKSLKEKYLPRVASGAAIAAFAISEEGAGSDISALSTSGKKEGANYIVNGSKAWISNAGIADFYLVFCRTEKEPGAKGLTAFVVDANSEGLEVTEKIELLAPHPIGTLRFRNVKIPTTQMVGSPGEGFKVALETLDLFRCTVGAAALGFARSAMEQAVNRSMERKAYGHPLSDFQLTQQKIADMAVKIDASALLVYRAAWEKDEGKERITREAAMAKMYATEKAQQVIDSAVQIFGALGLVSGHSLEKLYREIRLLRIYEGTTEIQKLIIAKEVFKHCSSPSGGVR